MKFLHKRPKKVKAATGNGDCMISALVNLKVMPYSKAFKFTTEMNQKFYPKTRLDSSHGVIISNKTIKYMCDNLGFVNLNIPSRVRTLEDAYYLLKRQDENHKYLIIITGHALAFIDGQLVDSSIVVKPRKHVKWILKLI